MINLEVVIKRSVFELIAEAKALADEVNQEIECIYLSPEEAERLERELSGLCPGPGGLEYRAFVLMGVKIKKRG